MLRLLLALSIFTALACAPALLGEPGESAESIEILNKYLSASEHERDKLRGIAMEADIEAKLVRLKKEGRLHALRYISQLGRITYNALRFSGDNTVKKEVIARYLTAESQAQDNTKAYAITPENYKFKYKGLQTRANRRVHLFEVRPHKKKIGLFKGDLWIDPQTYLAVRESGVFVKNPSLFLKKVQFVRDYEMRDGVNMISRVNTVIDTRLVGRAELSISYTGVKKVADDADAAQLSTTENQ